MQRSALIPNRTRLSRRSRAYMRTPVTWSTCPQATIYSLFGPVPVTRVEPLNQGVVKASYDSLYARDRLLNRVRLGIRAERCIAAFSD